ncbi:hypothetical protein DPMN_092914 [Dreissena polymorpha]|uniref:Uncharacterized protein n=1 Tax=Dreissena polymorpha TaxID=45954 RepID=A0A9D4R1F2_DREPO|nr:hypothetical protein DPMN_092914 [Dreissena polymorpha]
MYVTGTAIRPLMTLKRRTKSKNCRRCWRDGHWRVERMDVTLSGWCGLNGLLATNLAVGFGQWATPHRLSDVRRRPSYWIWNYLKCFYLIIQLKSFIR